MASQHSSINVVTQSDEIVYLNNIPLRFSMIEADIPKIQRYYWYLTNESDRESVHLLRELYRLKLESHCIQMHNEHLKHSFHRPDPVSDEDLLRAILQCKSDAPVECQGCPYRESQTLFTNGPHLAPLQQCRDFISIMKNEHDQTLAQHVETNRRALRKYALYDAFIRTQLSMSPPSLFPNQWPLLAFLMDELTDSIVGFVHIWWSHGYSLNSPLIIEFDFHPQFEEYRPELLYHSVNALIRLTVIDSTYEQLADTTLINRSKFIVFLPVKGCTTDWRAIRQVVFDHNINHDVCTASLPSQISRSKF